MKSRFPHGKRLQDCYLVRSARVRNTSSAPTIVDILLGSFLIRVDSETIERSR